MAGSCGTWFNRRWEKNTRPATRALLFVEQLEKREVRSVVYWTGGAGTTNWDRAGNWSTVDPLKSSGPSQVLPGPTDTVIIDLPGVTVDHSDPSQDVIGSLQVTAANVTFNLSTGNRAWPTPSTLDLSGAGGSGTFQVDQPGDVVHLGLGTLKDATVTSGTTIVSEDPGGGTSPSGMPIVSGPGDGTLDGVTLDGKLEEPYLAKTTIRNGLILNGVIDLNNSPGALTFDDSSGPQTLSGQGRIDLSGSLQVSGATLTIAAGITIHGGITLDRDFPIEGWITGPIDNFGKIVDDSGGYILINYDQNPGSLYVWSGSAGSLIPWTNNGTIEVSNGMISLGGLWINNGTITAGSGTTLNLGDGWAEPFAPLDPNPTGDAWVNNGTISTDGTDVSLGGNLTWSPTNLDLAVLGLGKDTVSIQGTLDNSSHTLTLTPGVTSVTGSWTLGPGQIDGGTVDERAAPLVVNSFGTLNGVTLIKPLPADPPSGPSLRPLDPIGNPLPQSLPSGAPEIPANPQAVFLNNLYTDLLHRQADAAGFNSWMAALNSSVTRFQVALAFQQSGEYRTGVIDSLYSSLLGRSPDAGGLSAFLGFMDQGGSALQVEQMILGSAEFYQHAGASASGFLTALYHAVLGRTVDPSGAAGLGALLARGTSTASVAGLVLSSRESEQDVVESIYQRLLHRAADASGLATFTAALAAGLSDTSVAATVAASAEFVGTPSP